MYESRAAREMLAEYYLLPYLKTVYENFQKFCKTADTAHADFKHA
jgi:hypothetical protein